MPTSEIPDEASRRDTTAEASQTPQPPESPPLPQRHTAVTPGPRAARFQELYAQSLRRTLAKAGWSNFAGCYPTVARGSEGVLKQVQGQMVDKLGEKCEVSLCRRGDWGKWAEGEQRGSHCPRIMESRLTLSRKREFESIMASRQVVAKLNELEGLIGDATNRRASSTTETDPTP